MENASEADKYGIVISGQQFCDKLEHIPIKKRILLRDSALYQRTPPPAQVEDPQIRSPNIQLSELTESPASAHLSDPNLISKQQACSLESNQLVNKRRGLEALNNEKSDLSQDFCVIKTHTGSTCIDRSKTVEDANITDTPAEVTCSGWSNTADNADKDRIAEASSPCTGVNLPSVSVVSPTAKNDDMIAKSPECIPLSVQTGYSFSKDKPAVQPDNVSHKVHDRKTEQPATQDSRILWDLNVSMEDWEKPIDDQTDVTSYDCLPSMEPEKFEHFKQKEENVVSNSGNESDKLPTASGMTSGGLYPTAEFTNFIFKSAGEDQQIIGSTNSCCDQKLSSNADDERTLMHGEDINKLSSGVLRSNSATTALCTGFVNEQDFENKIVIEGEGSGILLPVCDDSEDSSPKSRISFKSGELEVTATEGSSSNRCAEILDKSAYDEEGNESKNMDEKIICETVKADVSNLHSSKEFIGKSSQLVDVKAGEQTRSCVPEVFSALNVEPPYAPKTNNTMPCIDKDCGALTEQDYEDGELRELDAHGWNEVEMGETDCLDYEPVDGRKDFISSLISGKDEGMPERKKSRLSKVLTDDHMVRDDGVNADDKVASGIGDGVDPETPASSKRLEKKLSGWDQFPRDGHAPSEKALEELGISSRVSRSELQPCIDVQTLSEDAEEKETVVEQKIRLKNIDNLYPAESSFGFDKFTDKRRSTSHVHGKNKMEEWDSERRSSINYHDVYDNYSRSRRPFMSSRGRGHHRRSRSRSPSGRNDTFEAHNNYSRFSRGRFGKRAEGSGRGLREARNGYRGSLTDDRVESEFCMPPQYLRRDRSFSPRGTPHFSETFNRSGSRSRSRSPPHWLSSDELMGPRSRQRSPGFRTEDRLKRTLSPRWKTSFAADNETRYSSPPRGGFMPHNKSRWNDDEDFEMSGPRDRSPVRSFRHKEKFSPACSQGRFRSSDDGRPLGYCGRMREITSLDRSRGYLGGNDRRKCEGSYETGHPKRYFKDGFSQQYRHDPENNTAPKNCLVKDDFLEGGESRLGNMRKKERRSAERYDFKQESYQGSYTPHAKR